MSPLQHKPSKAVHRLVFQPRTSRGMQQGINQVVDAIRPTLGPVARAVAVSQAFRDKRPELLDKGALIARRITDLPDRDSDMGAMVLRHMLWRLYEEMGDGTATAALLFQAIYRDGLKYIAAGGNAMRLAHYLNEGLERITCSLEDMSQTVSGEAQFAQLAQSICHDSSLAAVMGEVFDVIGEYGQLDVRTGRGRETDREYVEGMYWKGGAVSRQMLKGGSEPDYVMMPDAAILLSDLEIEDVHTLAGVLAALMKLGIKSFLILAEKFSEDVINFLLANKDTEKFRAVAVKLPGTGPVEQMATLQDIAILTGGIPLHKAAGDHLENMTVEHLGHARRVWVDRTMFGIVSGRRSARALRTHIKELRLRLEKTSDQKEREALEVRLGKLLGGVATLLVGGDSEWEIEMRKKRAQQTAKVLRQAVRGGILPGGGAALLDCQAALAEHGKTAQNADERAAYRILHDALELRCAASVRMPVMTKPSWQRRVWPGAVKASMSIRVKSSALWNMAFWMSHRF